MASSWVRQAQAGSSSAGHSNEGRHSVKILVTGGTGSVGLSLVETLLNEGIEVVVYALSPPAESVRRKLETHGPVTFEQGDVRDGDALEHVFQRHHIDAVAHAAAITPDAAAELDLGSETLSVNCGGALAVLAAASRAGVERFVHVSSVAAYGASATSADALEEESTPDDPETLYELSKFTAERAVLRVGQALAETTVVSARVGDVFGRWEHPTAMRTVMSAPYQVLHLALAGEAEARLPRTGRKQWVYSKDVAQALHLLLTVPALKHRVYNISSPFFWGVDDWCALVSEAFPEFHYRTLNRADVGNVPAAKGVEGANVTLFRDNAPMALERITDAGYSPQFDINSAFQDYLGWVQAHRDTNS